MRSFFRSVFLSFVISFFQYFFPLVAGAFAGVLTLNPYIASGAFLVFGAATPLSKSYISPTTFKLRSLDTVKFAPITKRYLSYYEINALNLKNYPAKNFIMRKTSYNKEQLRFFFDFADEALSNKQLNRIVSESSSGLKGQMMSLNSTEIQSRLATTVGAGREIGNFHFTVGKKRVEPPKFKEILKTIKKDFDRTVIYSNYYNNGLLLFAEYLKRNGLREQIQVLDVNATPSEQKVIIDNYNSGKKKILLLHPEVTEGVSLIGTQQFHMLEPPINSTLQEQVIGRAVRFKSHSHLPKNKRKVDIYLWESVLDFWSMATHDERKANWRKRYFELSDWSNWGMGISQIDPNYNRKEFSPDTYASIRLAGLQQSLIRIKELLKTSSIESLGGKK